MKTICVMGLGYIGLPTASILASGGFKVLGVDVDSRVVDTVNSGRIHIEEPGLQTVVKAAIQSGNLHAALEPAEADVFFIAVPTPLTTKKKADMSYVVKAAQKVVPFLKPGTLVILESTSPPGTCRNLLAPILEESGLKAGEDFALAHCPERVLPGKILKELIQNDRVIGGFSESCAQKAGDIYKKFVEGEIFLTDVTTAEMVKVVENTYRDVNIALANEVAVISEKIGINFADVMRLANRHPRVNLHKAGPGVGGHCISVDPWFLVEQFPDDAKLIGLARWRNDSMPQHVVQRTKDLLKGVEKPKVAVLGIAFKGNVDDVRESPALQIVQLLMDNGFNVDVHDPYVKNSPFQLAGLDQCFNGADCVLLLTDHDDYKYINPRHVATHVRRSILFDTRNVLDHKDWEDAAFTVAILGSSKHG